MDIITNNKQQTAFSHIVPGEVFTTATNIEGVIGSKIRRQYYLKTDDNITDDVNAINLQTGVQCRISQSEVVHKIIASLGVHRE